MPEQFSLGVEPPTGVENRYFFIYSGYHLLARKAAAKWFPLAEQAWQELELEPLSQHYLGLWNDAACFAVELSPDAAAPQGFEWRHLRQFLYTPDDALFALAGRGLQLIEWHRTHRFCGSCGAVLVTHERDHARVCVPCKRSFYPRLSPCIIVLVTRGEELLLARGARHREGVFSTLAGFVEPGETAEQAVHREVREEVGIAVQNLRYWGSQPWPFPHQLMLGFFADYKAGELVLEDDEIIEAHWWHYRRLPALPPATTISGRLIHGYLQQLG